MDSKTVFSKTAKGMREVSGASSSLPRALRAILKEIDGKSAFSDLKEKLQKYSEAEFKQTLESLETEGYIRDTMQVIHEEAPPLPYPPAKQQDHGDFGDLDFTALAARPAPPASPPPTPAVKSEARHKVQAARPVAEAKDKTRQGARDKARREVETKASLEAELDFTPMVSKQAPEAKARREAEEKQKREEAERQRKEAEERARIEAEAKAKQEAEAKARREAEEKARREAEEKRKREEAERQRKEAEERARIEAEPKAKQEAEAKARREAEEKARREAEEKQKREEAERQRKEAEERARVEAEAKAKQEAEAKARREAKEKARREAEEKQKREEAERQRKEAEERARVEAEAKAKQEAEAKARREAEEKARREAEEKQKREEAERQRKEAEERARVEAEAKAKQEAEAKARREAEEKARREAEEKQKREEAERQRKEAEERARVEAEAKAKQEAEAKARREAEEKARREAEEKQKREEAERQRKEAEERARIEAEAEAKQEAEAKARREAEERARREAEQVARQEEKARISKEAETKLRYKAEEKVERQTREQAEREAAIKTDRKAMRVFRRSPVEWGKLTAIVIVAMHAIAFVRIQFMSFDERIPGLEKAASEQFQQPVKIKGLRFSLFPQPHWRLEGASIGSEGQITVPKVKAVVGLSGLLDDGKTYKSVELESPVLKQQAAGWLLFGKSQGQAIRISHIRVNNALFESQSIDLPRFNAKADIGAAGNWQKIVLEISNRDIYDVELFPDSDRVRFEINGLSFQPPFGGSLQFDDFIAKGTFGREEMKVSEFEGRTSGGSISGSANLKWASGWSIDGTLKAKQLDTRKLAPALFGGGRVDGKATYAMRAKDARTLFTAPRIEGSFAVGQGELLGVDLMHLLQHAADSGKTGFRELTGTFVHDRNATQLRQLRLTAGIISASGSAVSDANGTVRGSIAASYKFDNLHTSASVGLSGKLDAPRFSR